MNKIYHEFRHKNGRNHGHIVRCPTKNGTIKQALEKLKKEKQYKDYVYFGPYEEHIREEPKHYCDSCENEIPCSEEVCESCKRDRPRCEYDVKKICNGCMDC